MIVVPVSNEKINKKSWKIGTVTEVLELYEMSKSAEPFLTKVVEGWKWKRSFIRALDLKIICLYGNQTLVHVLKIENMCNSFV